MFAHDFRRCSCVRECSKDNFVLDLEEHLHLWNGLTSKLEARPNLGVLLVGPLELEEMSVHGNGVLENQFSKSLSKADSLATQKGTKCQRISLTPIWLQR